VVVGTAFLANYVHPRYAAILYSLPLQFTAAAVIVYLESGKITLQQVTLNAIFYIIAFVLFLLVFYFLLTRADFWKAIGISYVVLIIAILLILKITHNL